MADLRSITLKDVENYEKEFYKSDQNIFAMNTVTSQGIVNVARGVHGNSLHDHNTYSVQVEEASLVTNQKKSGRCWMFAALNIVRMPFIKHYNLANNNEKGFEFSQSYLYFYQKLEVSNWHLEQIIDIICEKIDLFLKNKTTKTNENENENDVEDNKNDSKDGTIQSSNSKIDLKRELLNDRLFSYILSKASEDGSQFDMFLNLIEKYGIVPKNVFPEVKATENTNALLFIINSKVREYSCIYVKISDEYVNNNNNNNNGNINSDDLRKQLCQLKKEQLSEIYNILLCHFGIPPKVFDWNYRDKSKKYHSISNVTPLQFYQKYVKNVYDLSKMVSLVHDPRNEMLTHLTIDRVLLYIICVAGVYFV